jgi:hypothetical protein
MKCYQCKADNMTDEAKKHDNATTRSMARILRKRAKETNHKDSRHFCEVHLAK